MKKFFVLWLTVLLIAVMACTKKEREGASSLPPIPVPVNDLPAMSITLLDGTTVDARELKGKNILVLFQPDCDHCQHEAEQIKTNLESFKEYAMYFVSSAPQAEIEKFAIDYQLKDIANIYFGITSSESVINNFGPIQAPSIYIYADQKLVKDFSGQVDVSVIIQYL
jgi:thiol-disulfide isomerase/thioredoxin